MREAEHIEQLQARLEALCESVEAIMPYIEKGLGVPGSLLADVSHSLSLYPGRTILARLHKAEAEVAAKEVPQP